MLVPADKLSPLALRGLIVEFVTRDGTDYGSKEVSEAEKVAQVERQLRSGEVLLVFDAESQTCNLMTKDAYRALAR
jgi:uncharacterized protein